MQNDRPQAGSITYAGFFVRLTAYFIDRCILFIPLLLLRVLPGLFTGGSRFSFARDVFFTWSAADVLVYAAGALYFIIMTYSSGSTLGKKLMRIEVVGVQSLTQDSRDSRERKPSLYQIIYRETVGRFLSSALLFIGYLLIVVGKEKEAMHDYLADTRVVYRFNDGSGIPKQEPVPEQTAEDLPAILPMEEIPVEEDERKEL